MSGCIEIPKNVDSQCVVRLQELVSSIRSFLITQTRRASNNVELEIRLGNAKTNGNFSSDIGEISWMKFIGAMDAQRGWTKIIEPYEIIDFFYTVEKENGVKKHIRTSRYIKDGAIHLDHLEKKRVNMCMLNIFGVSNLLNTIKVSFNTEEQVAKTELPEVTSTSKVRIKHRRSYVWKEWRYDLTTVWTAPTYAGCIRIRDDPNMSQQHATFEIEVECVDPLSYFEKQHHTDEYISVSILMKIIGMLPKTNINIK